MEVQCNNRQSFVPKFLYKTSDNPMCKLDICGSSKNLVCLMS